MRRGGIATWPNLQREMADGAVRLGESRGCGRGVFACRPLERGEAVLRALPCALVPNDAALLTRCAVCLRADAERCARCDAAALCARCARSGARQIHEDECATLHRLARAPTGDGAGARPSDTRTLRMLIRVLFWRRRAMAGTVADEWWGDGDVRADGDIEDVLDLAEPPAHLLSDSLRRAFVHTAQQARYLMPADARCGLELAASLVGILYCNSLTIYGEKHEVRVARPTPSSGLPLFELVCTRAQEIGVALSGSVAMLNHSCEPSASWAIDDDGCVEVRRVSRAGDTTRRPTRLTDARANARARALAGAHAARAPPRRGAPTLVRRPAPPTEQSAGGAARGLLL